MDIFEKAKELGVMIASSEEMTRYKKSEAEYEGDDKSKTLMNEYKMLQIEMVKATEANQDKDTLDSIKERLLAKQEEINNYDKTRNYLEAKAELDKLMKRINDVMIFAITGEESCSPSKCSTCGGCK